MENISDLGKKIKNKKLLLLSARDIPPYCVNYFKGKIEAYWQESAVQREAMARDAMSLHKYVANRLLTLIENMILHIKLSKYHTGFRAVTREVLETLPLEENSDDFVFDNEILVQAVYFNFRIGEISCPNIYFKEASSINFWRSIVYGVGVLSTSLKYVLHRLGISRFMLLSKNGRRLHRG